MFTNFSLVDVEVLLKLKLVHVFIYCLDIPVHVCMSRIIPVFEQQGNDALFS